MFSTVSMNSTGIIVLVISLVLGWAGVEADTATIEGAVVGLITLAGWVLTVWGALRRKDLEFGLFRK